MLPVQNRGMYVVLGGFLIHLVLGELYLWPIISPAVTSYLRGFEPSLTYQDTIMVFGSTVATQGISMLIGGSIEPIIGAQMTVIFGGSVIVLGQLLASMATSLHELIWFDGIFFGFGMGICYAAPISSGLKWLPSLRGWVTGTIIAGFGGGVFLFGQVSLHHTNPHNQVATVQTSSGNYFEPDSEIAQSVPSLFIKLGLMYAVLIAIGASLIKEPSELSPRLSSSSSSSSLPLPSPTIELVENGCKTSSHKKSSKNGKKYLSIENNDDDHVTYHHSPTHLSPTTTTTTTTTTSSSNNTRSIATIPFGAKVGLNFDKDMGPIDIWSLSITWQLAFCFTFTTIGGIYFAGTYKTTGMKYFNDDALMSNLGTVAALCNCTGRTIIGLISDYYGESETLTVYSLLFAGVLLTYPYSVLLGKTAFCVWTLGMFALEGGNFTLYVPVMVRLFGVKYSSANYGLIFIIYSLFNVSNIWILSHLRVDFHQAATSMAIVTLLGSLNYMYMCKRLGWTGWWSKYIGT